ncbi:MAG: hypothetical protein EA412_05055 [Chitinophagaceae bacterium]|nr:MAG: hypothetical protein EA412_05055 [Chitinophagaceae bacterium]
MTLVYFYQLILALLGLVLLIKGADFFVESASAIAKKLQIPEFIIGFTIIALGTSLPEFGSNIYSSAIGHDDFIVGNIIGSNLFNLLAVLGICSLMFRVYISPRTLFIDWTFSLILSVLLMILIYGFALTSNQSGFLSRADGLVLIFLFIGFYIYIIRTSKKDLPVENEKFSAKSNTWNILSLIGGLAALLLGSKLAVDGLKDLSGLIGISQHTTAVILLAGGTSLPELSTAYAAFKNNKGNMAVGSIIGSNIINIGLILGISVLIHPTIVLKEYFNDLSFLIVGTTLPLIVLIFMYASQKKTGKLPYISIALGTVMMVLFLTFLYSNINEFLGL